jgi:hypothetical protein
VPIVRRRVYSYIVDWNHDRIQHQPRRSEFVPGIPFINYYHADVQDLRCTINTDPASEQAQFLQGIHQYTQAWNANEYLPVATLAWCQQQLTEIAEQLAGMGILFNSEDPSPRLIRDP